jgi:uncharacterized phage protein (TIGR01671 family)
MREIKFRGLDVMTGDWVFGFLVRDLKRSFIVEEVNIANEYGDGTDFHAVAWSQVDKETVGQFTGLYAKSSKEIFEGDIVYQEFYDNRPLDVSGFLGVVRKYEGAWRICNGINHSERLWSEMNINEVVGNIYDNPELLEDYNGGLLKLYESGTL